MIWLTGGLVALVVAIALFPKGDARVGLMDAQLRPCPDTPNCVCSEDTKPSAAITALEFTDTPDTAWQRANAAIAAAGGEMQAQEADYLWASFTTRWLRFVDDVELRLDRENQVIHVRSASRVGRSDLGVNRARVEKIRVLFVAGAKVE